MVTDDNCLAYGEHCIMYQIVEFLKQIHCVEYLKQIQHCPSIIVC